MVQKRRPFAIGGCSGVLFLLFCLVAGLATAQLGVSQLHSSTLACWREKDVVLCEFRYVYPGSWITTERVELDSVAVERRSSTSRRGVHYYDLLVLNDGLEVPLGSVSKTDEVSVAARLNDLLEGKTTTFPRLLLREPSYGMAIFAFALGGLLASVGALGSWVITRASSRPGRAEQRRKTEDAR